MRRILLGLTGSVAAVKAPELVASLRARNHDVTAVATDAATYFFNPNAIGCPLVRDADEWPADRYDRGDPVRHIELRNWADLFLIAPLDANTLAKLALGLADNCLTCVWRAWNPAKPVVLAPAMNTLMWENSFTRRHLRSLAADFGAGHLPGHLDQDQLLPLMNDRCRGLRVIPPVVKELACGDFGIGAMGSIPDIVEVVSISGSSHADTSGEHS